MNDDSTFAFAVGDIALHDGRRGLVAQESTDQIDANDFLEIVAGHGALLAHQFSSADDAGAVHQYIDAAHRPARGFNRGDDVRLDANIAGEEGCPYLSSYGLTERFLQVEDGGFPACRYNPLGNRSAQTRRAAGNDCQRFIEPHNRSFNETYLKGIRRARAQSR